MSYWDTSTLVKLYAKESDSATFENQALIGASKTVTSRIAVYEARSSARKPKASSNPAQHSNFTASCCRTLPPARCIWLSLALTWSGSTARS